MYDFQAPYDSTLTFAENDLFVVLKRNNKDHEWVHVIKLNGENGYAPANYLTVADCTKTQEIKHIDDILVRIASRRTVSRDQAAVVENLKESREKLAKELEDLAAKQMYDLTSLVRQNTKCTFRQAQGAILETLKYFQENVLPIPDGIDRILNTDTEKIPMEVRHCGVDSQHLDRLVGAIMEFASDQETDVSEETWNEMLNLITHADPALLISALERHDCALILQLVHRLQAETSWRKRKPILAILFHALQLLPTFVNVAINSVLPSELARDIQTTCTVQDTNKDRVYWSIRVLTVTLCCREPLSFAQQNELGENLVELLVNLLENESVSIATTDERDDECLTITTAAMHLILALYRQFNIVSLENNPVLLCLARRSMCDSLVEKIILLYNREDDPIKQYVGDDDNATDAVSNLMFGLFSGAETAKLFYTADLDVLLDVILRRLADYGPGDKRRSDALQLYYAIQRVKSPEYKKLDFAKCLKAISEESARLGSPSKAMQQDHHKILQIYHEFPDFLDMV
ncbi:hypothetical protein DAPPUDRAFT_306850 [Daphnia pulex]|uniref:SH3 domain-containing protein n=1 Tax=Daphnia pulex TaxID=6669 RepID=E9GZ27_DAPPU|nr:hypothetical protein DAPPUDRAFT_306850 [Daphnia pulex]|eukprot:EFX75255.1 hypothetical protein DAPPUDRAFT_306850 [Daphnia pulex]